MKITFGSPEIAQVCNDDTLRVARFGPALSAAIRRRLGQITAVAHLAELRLLPAARLRPDSTRTGFLLVALDATADLLTRPRDAPAPPEGGMDEHAVRGLLITDILR